MSALPSRLTRAISLVGATIAIVALAACSSSPSGSTSSSSSQGLQTLTAGKLTIATGQPAYSPWVIDNKPENGQGFESAVAYAVAEKLGFAKKDVVWTRTTFDSAIAPGPKDFDLNIQQFSISDERKKAVDFSSPYYTTTQAIVTTKGSPAASVTTLDGLKKVKIGVATATTTYTLLKKEVGGNNIAVFNSNDDAVLALKTGQIDAVATDLPTAFYLADAQVDNGVVGGQFADNSGGDKFGIVLAKGSPLTAKVASAVDALRTSGELDTITKKWLSTTVNVPVFK
ncbi:ABC transporter substrate-binding protein [Diaminobutyricibacter sp. McL0618]|uniref:ABC transporter substrate-binding protein n=1 Tax=Leifsonia sp. McL0618 TaxID=3415677 RepID=UPI003CEC5214